MKKISYPTIIVSALLLLPSIGLAASSETETEDKPIVMNESDDASSSTDEKKDKAECKDKADCEGKDKADCEGKDKADCEGKDKADCEGKDKADCEGKDKADCEGKDKAKGDEDSKNNATATEGEKSEDSKNNLTATEGEKNEDSKNNATAAGDDKGKEEFQDEPAVPLELKDNEVGQGGILRWAVEGATKCGMDGKTWPAVDGVAYYPIDIEEEPGEKTIKIWVGDEEKSKTITVLKQDYGQEAIDLPGDPTASDAKSDAASSNAASATGETDKEDCPDCKKCEKCEAKDAEAGKDDRDPTKPDASSFVEPEGEDLKRSQEEYGKVMEVVKGTGGDPKFTLPLGEPCALPEPAPNFAVRRVFNGVPKNRHTGQDYGIGKGTELKAMADGKVVLAGDHFFAGKSMYVDHGAGLVIMYFHLDEFVAEEGQEVKKGDVIAKSGDTGRGTGAHLHIGARWNDKRIDPKLLMASPDSLPTVKE